MRNPIRSMAMAVTLPFIQPVTAELPMLEAPWLGYFAVAQERDFQFLFSSKGGLNLMALDHQGAPIQQSIGLQFLGLKTLPDGSIKELPMALDTFESSDPPTAKLKKTIFSFKLVDQATGQTTGQPTMEGTIEIVSGTVLANARVIDKGASNTSPIQPVIRTIFTAFYVNENIHKETWNKKQTKEFEKRIGADSVTLKHLDQKQVKLVCADRTDPKSKEVNGVGSSLAEVEISFYQKRRIEILAAPNSSLTLCNAGPAPLHNGFWFQWSADAAKDPDGKAKLAIRIK